MGNSTAMRHLAILITSEYNAEDAQIWWEAAASKGREMLISSLVAAVVFFLLFALVYHSWGNHGLWLSFLVYLLIRGVLQTVFFHRSLMDKEDSLL